METETVEAVETKKATKAKPMDDVTFIRICETVAKRPDASIQVLVDEIAKQTPEGEKPMAYSSVVQRRTQINTTYKPNFKLTQYPRGTKPAKPKDLKANLAAIAELQAELNQANDTDSEA